MANTPNIPKQFYKAAGLVFFVFLIIASCSEVIELDIEASANEVVIYGRISNSYDANEIFISRTQGAESAALPISGASVQVIDNNGLVREFLENEPGVYVMRPSDAPGEFGSSYRLEAVIDGKVYSTEFQELMPVISQDELRYEIGVERDITSTGANIENDVVKIFADSKLPDDLPEDFFIRWEIEEAYSTFTAFLPVFWFPRAPPRTQCYVVNKLGADQIFLLDGRVIRRNDLNNRPIITRVIDNSFQNKHYFNLIQSSISQENHDYWDDVRSLTISNGTIFDPVLGKLQGNISSNDPGEEVFGFFEVIGIDTTRLLMTNNDIPVFFVDPCLFLGDRVPPLLTVPPNCVQCLIDEKIVEESCIFCSAVPNSTSRPNYY
ncbi:DUF4249 family protein [Roseivirga misakiensis]|uniref:DUF4249 domain-containing protein n=1 Tax=Roseivirga misakiensis TaxID=1563681 RepID=A0A1E5T5D0_9BACT|nr:DUF4249 family protein [Roseivirga misakiensis]OEK06570.1 hypothetical protein BFP71_02545 [Roseivirga misakiensis]